MGNGKNKRKASKSTRDNMVNESSERILPVMKPASYQEEFGPETVSEAESNELPDGSESEEPVDVVHKQVKDEPNIVLHVPDCTEPEGFIERVKIPASVHFNDVEERVFKAIGCYKNVTKMPQIAYRLKRVHDKHLSKLAKEDGWATLKDDVKGTQVKKKKGDASGVEVEIVLDEDYMVSLRHTLSGKKGKMVANNGGRGRKKREAQIHDLNADSDANSGSDIEERGQLTKWEKDYMEALKVEYSNCGKSTCVAKVCKLTKNGENAHLSWNQLQSWVVALVSEMHGVTLKTPPNNSHFRDFHYRKEENVVPKEKSEEVPMQNIPGHAPLSVQGSFPVMQSPGFFPQYNYRAFAQNIHPVRPTTPPNSGKSEPIPTTPGNIDFPSINDFLEEVVRKAIRNLVRE
ncbi:hypothetical protein JB92DRAFT_3102606 [Gautieria morchelliformis]|nr:hypothetical protein JB92DRAFT_3102606 [Gautieria morchelliformis]